MNQLRAKLRKLWTDHVLWTRQVIISVAHGLPDLKPTLDRLLKNQDQIGAAIVPYLETLQPVKGEPGRFVMTPGIEAGKKLAGLLRVHIKIAAEVLMAAKDHKDTASAVKRWEANADEIAGLLVGLSPSLPENQARSAMREHLALTLKEATKRISGDFAGDIAEFDQVLLQALRMADMMAAVFAER